MSITTTLIEGMYQSIYSYTLLIIVFGLYWFDL